MKEIEIVFKLQSYTILDKGYSATYSTTIPNDVFEVVDAWDVIAAKLYKMFPFKHTGNDLRERYDVKLSSVTEDLTTCSYSFSVHGYVPRIEEYKTTVNF